jgi:hypothetical protein
MTEDEVSEMIERHIEFVDKDGRPVRLPSVFVRRFMKRKDNLPIVTAIATLPIVLADGGLLAQSRGLNRERGIIFHIPQKLIDMMPVRENISEDDVRKAMDFLREKWLCDVATDAVGNCILIADALTIIERSLLPDRPVFFVTAGRRSSGKTTTLRMVIMAVTGLQAAGAAWSYDEEERRKAIFSYFLYGMQYILWDNIKRGSQISCPHIERSCTSAYYSDRRLGVSEAVATAAATIHHFTGNNISPKGDLASRALQVVLEVDRPDPENRSFQHTYPVEWTEEHRAEILQAFYTILLANPMLDKPRNAPCKTRFKMWWRLIGSAVEHAAALTGIKIVRERGSERFDFEKIFLTQEDEDEHSADLAQALVAMWEQWEPEMKDSPKSKKFKAIDVADVINKGTARGNILRDFLCSNLQAGQSPTAKSVGRMLKKFVNEPVQAGDNILTLKAFGSHGGREANRYFVHARNPKAAANPTPDTPDQDDLELHEEPIPDTRPDSFSHDTHNLDETVSVRVVKAAPTATCVLCGKAGDIHYYVANHIIGCKAEPLHHHCAAKWWG